jgi:CheY-like chemotaxis protein
MPTIAIIDDRKDHRSTIKRLVDTELLGDWDSSEVAPLADLEDYPSWLTENEVAVILLDERLNEQRTKGKNLSNYEGHHLVEFIRQHLPTLPIFVITSYPDDQELKKKFKDVEEIIVRQEFARKAAEYVPRFLRSGQRYLEAFHKELRELADSADKIARGKATKGDIERVKAIQAKIGMIFPCDSLKNRCEWTDELESNLKKLEKLSIDIKKFLQSTKHEMEKDS